MFTQPTNSKLPRNLLFYKERDMSSKPLSKLYFVLCRPKGVKPLLNNELIRYGSQVFQPMVDAHRWKFDQFRPYLVMG